MTRCYVSEQIAAYCKELEEVECPVCGGGMTEQDGNNYIYLACDDKECGFDYDNEDL